MGVSFGQVIETFTGSDPLSTALIVGAAIVKYWRLHRHNAHQDRRLARIEALLFPMIYSQTSLPWGPIHLGASSWTMADSGCVTTAITNALTLAGYSITPFDVVEAFNTTGVFTDNSYLVEGVPQPGLLYWTHVHIPYPQFTLNPNGAYHFVEVKWGANKHWVLQTGGLIYDPWNGKTLNSLPSAYKPTGYVVSADIALKPQVVETVATIVPVTTMVQVAVSAANLRTRQDLEAPVEHVVKQGTQLIAHETVGGDPVRDGVYNPEGNVIWYRVSFNGNDYLFISETLVKPLTQAS